MRDETADIYARVHHRVDEILHYVWDPIGVAGTPEARDEYDGYVPGVVRMLLDSADAEAIARHLHTIETESIGLTRFGAISKGTRRTAEMLVANYRWIQRAETDRT